jgi:GH35 family endo-1,4-beta-xylanase
MPNFLFILLLLLLPALPLTAQPITPISPATLALNSSATPQGDSLHFTESGFAGTYVQLTAAGRLTVTLTPQSPTATAATPTTFYLAIGRTRQPITLTAATPETFTTHFDLPPGTHLLRIEFAAGAPISSSTLTLLNLSLSATTPLTILNEHTDALALAAADTFIATGRQSTITLHLPPPPPGQPVTIRQLTHEFAFGGNVNGADARLVNPTAPQDSDAARFQKFFPTAFNAAVPSNMGKWAYNEPSPGQPTMQDIDAVLTFAAKHNMRTRMHALLWDTPQQPQWVLDLLTAATSGDAAAKSQLRQAITHRIDYYVRQRAARYHELDVLNESLHEPRYLNLFGPDELAEIYRQTASAAKESGSTASLFLNEYNVLQNSRRPPYGKGTPAGADDMYANWYRQHAQDLIARGAPLSGIGIQYYAGPDTPSPHHHSPARIAGVFHNLASTGLPLTLTEFGIARRAPVSQGEGLPTTRPLTDPATAQKLMDDSLRLAFGHPAVQGFYFFGFWENAMWNQAPSAILADKSFTPTPLGQHYLALRQQWSTHLTATPNSQGHLTFPAFHGTYQLTTPTGQTFAFTVTPTTKTITLP